MADNGKLEKLLILAFDTSEDAERGTKAEAKETFEALINPESYTLEYKVKTSDGQGQGTSGAQAKYEFTLPEELTFEFLFDNTGIIDGKKNKDGVNQDVDRFRKMLTGYQGKSHEPYHLKLVWGSLVFTGRATELSLTHKLFNPDGQPIRTVAKVKFKKSIEDKKRARKEDKSSADLTHRRTVKGGDTLPLLCYRIYGDPRYYLQVAQANGLNNFRKLVPNTNLLFPPLDKKGATP
ncbi:LysM peptidoglycan-binding domain-containing protein [Geomonas nitrogeniifigens]|uniref:LysM peptidoglycan-binding domain-containing protein n=1 Tax=Geomonas diazotrophica TaxID=2843197 RepID=A0ABX8JR13_9BACT|nr:LysM peptidoglycan-binding domain-containing protein [Geomonas nitrogeniifigens]QWV99069.1 LysM peptidoglycan-binding domain-containing protein [Geomonas nitrogeniifigens]QXE88237.1 LysM peptidoglycan-binding domain-containing protein [Geomonas nitrogeniifigens]